MNAPYTGWQTCPIFAFLPEKGLGHARYLWVRVQPIGSNRAVKPAWSPASQRSEQPKVGRVDPLLGKLLQQRQVEIRRVAIVLPLQGVDQPRRIRALASASLLSIAIADPASEQSLRDKQIGRLESRYRIRDFSGRERRWVPWSAGRLILDASGRMFLFVIKKDRPKGSGDPRSPVGPVVAYYETYTVNEADNTLTWKVEHATTSFDGATRTRKISIKGDSMTTTAQMLRRRRGTITPVNEWERVKWSSFGKPTIVGVSVGNPSTGIISALCHRPRRARSARLAQEAKIARKFVKGGLTLTSRSPGAASRHGSCSGS
jgi:hypothetical protein